MSLPFVGPSYQLATRKASVQRAVNLFLVGMETPSKAPFIMQSVPGLVQFASLGQEIRGITEAAGRCFFVAGKSLYELSSAGATTLLGSLITFTGPVDFAWGTTQLVVVDGEAGYVLTLATNAFAQISDADFFASDRVAYLDGYFIFAEVGTGRFQISSIDDASSVDALDFATAETSPDPIVAFVVNHREVWFMGSLGGEVWFDSGAADFPLSRNQGAAIEVGCIAAFSLRLVDNSVMWLGRDQNGSGIVYRASGYQPQRISDIAVEEALQSSTAISAAVAYVYQQNGQTFYCINAPGVASTWVYEVASNAWHERCDLDGAGQFIAHRATCHAYAFSKHLVGDANGFIYRMDPTVNTYAGARLKRTRISPNDVTPARDRIFYSEFALDCTTGLGPLGGAPVAELSWSDDGGFTYGNPVQRSVGATGNFYSRVIWNRLGHARDRVWRLDFSDDAPFAIINAVTR